MLAAQVQFMRKIGLVGEAIDFYLRQFDRYVDVLRRMGRKYKVSARMARHLQKFREGEWDEEYLMQATMMADIVPRDSNGSGSGSTSGGSGNANANGRGATDGEREEQARIEEMTGAASTGSGVGSG